jgi:DUF1365 family protein
LNPARLNPALYLGSVMHRRLRPLGHRLRYGMASVLLDLDELGALDGKLHWLSVNRFNLFSFHEGDHGAGTARGLASWVRQCARKAGVAADGPILLLTLPRILGFAFNPISVYFCHAATGQLSAILYEVNNTFGERHSYFIEVPRQAAGDRRIRQHCTKQMHVSPFMGMEHSYRFTVQPPRATSEGIALGVAVEDRQGMVLSAHYGAQRRPLTDRELLFLLVRRPFLTFKVVAAIHWEALRLLIKGLPFFTKPAPPAHSLTIERNPG